MSLHVESFEPRQATIWSGRTPDMGAPRRRGGVDGEVAHHDGGPEAWATDHERGDPDADRRPQRRHGAVDVAEAKAETSGAVVEPGDQAHLDRVPGEAPRFRLAPSLQTLGKRAPLLAKDRSACSTHPVQRIDRCIERRGKVVY